MPEIIDWHERRKKYGEENDLVVWLLVEAIARIPRYDGIPRYDQANLIQFDPKNLLNPDAIEVELKVNGEECSLVEILEELQKQYNDHIAEKAVELLKEKYGLLSKHLDEIREDLISSQNKISQELGITPEDRWLGV